MLGPAAGETESMVPTADWMNDAVILWVKFPFSLEILVDEKKDGIQLYHWLEVAAPRVTSNVNPLS